jgi:xylulokinase
MNILHEIDIKLIVIRAGFADLFLSPIFTDTLAQTAGINIELYNTGGAQGVARRDALGVKYFISRQEAFIGLERLKIIEPHHSRAVEYKELYQQRLSRLNQILQFKG